MPWGDVASVTWRTAALWVVALAVFRLMGKRTLGKMGAFDFAVIIMIGEATAIGMEDEKMSLAIPIASIVALGLLQWGLTWMNVRWRPLERMTQGTSTAVISEGQVQRDAMRRERLSDADLMMELRQQGIQSTKEVQDAFLEPTGKLSAFKKAKQPTS